jgi:hypothetical protein
MMPAPPTPTIPAAPGPSAEPVQVSESPPPTLADIRALAQSVRRALMMMEAAIEKYHKATRL